MSNEPGSMRLALRRAMHSSRHARSSKHVIPVSAASRSADASANMSGGSPSRSRDFCGDQ